jgi:VWFA-related protein
MNDRSRVQGSLFFLFTALAIVVAAQPAAAQPRERVVYVSVQERNGTPVTGLGPADLLVREDGVAREVLRVTPASDPMQIALLVDNSQAAEPDLQNIRDGLKAFTSTIAAGGQHQVSLVTLADRPVIAVDPTTSAATLEKGVERLFTMPGSGTYALEALIETTRGFSARKATRPVIVLVVTEGVEFSNSHYDEVIGALKEAGAALYALRLTDTPEANLRHDGVRNRNVVLDRGTRETGGYQNLVITSMALEGELKKVADTLLNQYKVVYSRPEALVPPEKITVETKRSELTARATPAREPRRAGTR